MNIALLYASWRNEGEEHSWPMAVHQEFLNRGHQVVDYNLYHANGQLHPKRKIRFYSDEGLNSMYSDIRSGLFNPDIIMQFDYGQHNSAILDKKFYPSAKWILEAGDDPQAFRANISKAGKFDLVLTPHLPCVEQYQKYGINAKWWTQSCDIDYLDQVTDVPIIFGAVSTCGPRGNGLTEKVKEALGNDFVYDRYYYNKDHTRRLKSGKIVFHHSQYGEIGRRVMEGMGCKKLVICDRLQKEVGLDSIFEENKEIVFYDSADDAIEKIKYYLSHDEERESIAEAGFNKVMQNHSVKARVDQLEQFIGNLS